MVLNENGMTLSTILSRKFPAATLKQQSLKVLQGWGLGVKNPFDWIVEWTSSVGSSDAKVKGETSPRDNTVWGRPLSTFSFLGNNATLVKIQLFHHPHMGECITCLHLTLLYHFRALVVVLLVAIQQPQCLAHFGTNRRQQPSGGCQSAILINHIITRQESANPTDGQRASTWSRIEPTCY